MKHSQSKLKWLLGVIAGSIIFVLLFTYATYQLPVFATKVTLAPAWLALSTTVLGPIAGGLIALIGHTFSDGLSGSIWWTWVLADCLYGILLGLTSNRLGLGNTKLTVKKLVVFNVWQIIANIIVWGIVAPLGDIWIYGEPAHLAIKQGMTAAEADIGVTLIFGTLFIVLYRKIWSNGHKK